MTTAKLRAGKFKVDASLVGRTVADQFPQWAGLPVRPVEFNGWDNWTFRLGEGMSVRLPSAEVYAGQVEKEQQWLPRLAPLLPLPIPVPLAMGVPSDAYPWHWSVNQWLAGENATLDGITDLHQFATTLAAFLVALQRIDPAGGPPPGQHSFFRGGPLEVWDPDTRRAIAALGDKIDTDAATEVWDAALDATWHGLPVWAHGDVSIGNLLIERGQLSAVIDFGCSAVGDPACDTTIAWTLFSGESRVAFRGGLPPDSATWARGRGWALWKALIVVAGTNAFDAESGWRVIDAVVADHKDSA